MNYFESIIDSLGFKLTREATRKKDKKACRHEPTLTPLYSFSSEVSFPRGAVPLLSFGEH